MTKRIYGIVGRKGHGKDTFAKAMRVVSPNFAIFHFADALKTMCAEIFGLTDYQMHDPIGKETPLTDPVKMDDFVPKMREVTGLNIKPAGLVAELPRQILQYFGTDYVRTVNDSYWVDKVLEQIADTDQDVIIPDTRFPNELDALKKIGGKIVRVVRVGKADDKNSSHASETSVDNIAADYTFSFKEGQIDKIHLIGKHFAVGDSSEADAADPLKQMHLLVDYFNMELKHWRENYGWGANIVPAYDKFGQKYFVAKDFAPIPTSLPSQERIDSAGKIIEGALNETLAANAGRDRKNTSGDASPSGDRS